MRRGVSLKRGGVGEAPPPACLPQASSFTAFSFSMPSIFSAKFS